VLAAAEMMVLLESDVGPCDACMHEEVVTACWEGNITLFDGLCGLRRCFVMHMYTAVAMHMYSAFCVLVFSFLLYLMLHVYIDIF
jgi:hypothetical protein